MVATFNGWEDMPEAEREALEQWEQTQRSVDHGTRRCRHCGAKRVSRLTLETGGMD
jgi:hypothetical protein